MPTTKGYPLKLDADTYRLNVEPIRMMTKDKTPTERFEFIGSIAVATGVPIIVVCYYMGEIYGFTPELYTMIQRLKDFYAVTEVLGVKE